MRRSREKLTKIVWMIEDLLSLVRPSNSFKDDLIIEALEKMKRKFRDEREGSGGDALFRCVGGHFESNRRRH